MLVSVTPLIEFPPAPPLAMTHSSKSTLLLKKKTEKQWGKTRSHHSYQEIFNSISTSNKSLDSGEVPSIS